MNPTIDIEWNDAIEEAPDQECVPVLSTDPLYILYTSGTTGDPKVNREIERPYRTLTDTSNTQHSTDYCAMLLLVIINLVRNITTYER